MQKNLRFSEVTNDLIVCRILRNIDCDMNSSFFEITSILFSGKFLEGTKGSPFPKS